LIDSNSRFLSKRELVVLALLASLSCALVASSRFALPAGLDEPMAVQPDVGFSRQRSGFVDVPGDNYRLGIVATGRARLGVDGIVVAETDNSGGAVFASADAAAGVHRIHLHDDPDERRGGAVLNWRRSGGRAVEVPAAALSPRRLAPAAWALRRSLHSLAMTLCVLWTVAVAIAIVRRASAWFRKRTAGDGEYQRAIIAVLGLSLSLSAYPLWWGLPETWALDEVGVVDGRLLAHILTPGWFDKYPPLHMYVLAVANAPFIVAIALQLFDLGSPVVFAAMMAVGRFVTVGMAVGTTATIYLCARRATSPRASVLSALIWSTVLTVAYYGKTSNLDIPYTFWFALSLLAYLQVFDKGAPRDYLLFATCAALAVCTKDQAYGLLALPAPHLALHRARSLGGPLGGLLRLARDRTILAALACGAAIFAVANNLFLNWSGFIGHIDTITGGASETYRMTESASIVGQIWLFGRAIDQIVWSMSWPGALLAAAGMVLACAQVGPTRRHLLLFLVPVASYYLTFIAVVGYHYDRFFIPVCLSLAVYAGYALDRLWPAGSGAWRTLASAAALVYMGLRAASLNLLMAADGRYQVEAWMRANVPVSAVVARFEFRELLPRISDFPQLAIVDPLNHLLPARPDVIVVSENFPRRFASTAPEVAWYGALVSGKLGYRVVLRHRAHVPLAIVASERHFRERDPSFTVLHKVNPEIVVLMRND
jgi:hypothetical protein